MPLESTVAIAVRFELHATALPVRTFPSASSGVAVSCTDCPGATLAVDGVMETLATVASSLVGITGWHKPCCSRPGGHFDASFASRTMSVQLTTVPSVMHPTNTVSELLRLLL
jgi:hypothetical protein